MATQAKKPAARKPAAAKPAAKPAPKGPDVSAVVADVEKLYGFVTAFAGLVKTYGFTSALLREVELLHDELRGYVPASVPPPVEEPTEPPLSRAELRAQETGTMPPLAGS